MRKLTIEQYVEIVNYFISQHGSLHISEDSSHTYSRAAFFLMNCYVHQDLESVHVAEKAWDRLNEPQFSTQMKYINEVMSK